MTFRLRWSTSLPFSPSNPPRASHQVLCHNEFQAAALEGGSCRWTRQVEPPTTIDWLLPHPRGAVLCERRDDRGRVVWLDHTGQERIVKGLEGWGSEAIVVGEDLWILRGATLSRLGADGTTLGQWEVPPGAEDLREENGIRFRVADDGLYLLKEGAKQATCTWKGQWDGSLCRDGWTFAWNADMMVARDPRGRHAWQRPDPGQLPALGDDVLFGTFRQGAQWWVMALETATGEVRWRAIREGQDEHGVLIPAGHSLGLWRLGPLEVLDVRDGKHLQTLEPPGDWFSATGPMSYRDGLLVLAADDKLVCYEAG